MQICYRCSKEIHTRLTEEAHEKGTSRNRLIDGIIQSHLGQATHIRKSFRQSVRDREILTEVRLANEKLAEILEAVNSLPFYMNSGTRPQENTDFLILRGEITGSLLDISRKLKDIHMEHSPSYRDG